MCRTAHAKVITDAKPSIASWRWATFADLKTSSTCSILENCINPHPIIIEYHVFVCTSRKSLELIPRESSLFLDCFTIPAELQLMRAHPIQILQLESSIICKCPCNHRCSDERASERYPAVSFVHSRDPKTFYSLGCIQVRKNHV